MTTLSIGIWCQYDEVLMQSVVFLYHYAKYHYAECHYVDCHYAECRYAECHYAECCNAIS
jgi:hypothetical protein